MCIRDRADAVKMEGGEEILESVQRILSAGIPVMGHLGLTPQSIHKFGTYAVRAKEEAEAEKLLRDAHLLLSLIHISSRISCACPAATHPERASKSKSFFIGVNGI